MSAKYYKLAQQNFIFNYKHILQGLDLSTKTRSGSGEKGWDPDSGFATLITYHFFLFY